ncbi:MAG TPA: MBL fold metallo-hydrolase [Syntrophomonadaceae bacterium]|nr:MBL fold metallo-hydrolase [Syntrophomonadaceae bacterium]
MIKAFNHEDVLCGHGKVKAFGTLMNVFLYNADGLLIDTGPIRLKSSIDFFNSREINQVAITHIHEDHSGMAWWLQANKNVPLYLSDISNNEAKNKAKLPLYRIISWGKRLPFKPLPYADIIETDKHSFQILNTPGHAEDHVTLYEKQEGWLFTGDLFLSTKEFDCLREENIPQKIKSLQMLVKLDFDTIFCGHSGVHHKNGKGKLEEKLDFLLEVQAQTKELHEKGLGLKEIDKKLFPRKSPVYYVSTGEWSSYNIINSIINDE